MILDLAEVPTETLLQALQSRCEHGVVALAFERDTREKVYCWWGDRDLCTGLTVQAGYGLSREISDAESDDSQQLSLPDGPAESPSFGTYL